MNCIIIDDEPLAREAVRMLIGKAPELTLLDHFSGASAAVRFMTENPVDLVFLDIQMPGTNGMDFAKSVPESTLVVFTTAYAEYALESYEVEAIDYLLKPINPAAFQRAVAKAVAYHRLLQVGPGGNHIETVTDNYFFVKAERRIFKVQFKDILFIEGLKDYVILHTIETKIITAMNIKTIHDQLPSHVFVRISKSFIINVQQIDSFDNNTVFIGKNEIPIGNAYRTYFFEEYVAKKLFSR